MAWVKVYEAVIGPKLRTLANDIGCSQNEALGVLVRLWVWGIRNVNAAGEIIGGSEADHRGCHPNWPRPIGIHPKLSFVR